jgi:hypothetical protein
MGLPTQKTCSTAGPLCIIHSPKRDLLGRGSSELCLSSSIRQVLRSLHGEGVFEFFHSGLQILDLALLFGQSRVSILPNRDSMPSIRTSTLVMSSLVAVVLKPSLIISASFSIVIFVYAICLQA